MAKVLLGSEAREYCYLAAHAVALRWAPLPSNAPPHLSLEGGKGEDRWFAGALWDGSFHDAQSTATGPIFAYVGAGRHKLRRLNRLFREARRAVAAAVEADRQFEDPQTRAFKLRRMVRQGD